MSEQPKHTGGGMENQQAAHEHLALKGLQRYGPRRAIIAKYQGPAGNRGARVVARIDGKRMSLAWDNAWSIFSDEGERVVAEALATELGWIGPDAPGWVLVSGAMPGPGAGYVFTPVYVGKVAEA